MIHRLTKWTLGGLALLSAGCAGHDISMTTGGAGTGGSIDAGGGSGAAGLGGSAPNESGGAGAGGKGSAPTGWVAFDANPGGAGRHLQISATDGSCQRALTAGDAQEKQPAFSPDGKQLAFAADNSGKYQIYVLDLATRERHQITTLAEGASYPSWSPDGKSIAFVTGDSEGDYNSSNAAMLVDTTTLDTQALTPYTQPPYTWSSFATTDLLLIGNQIQLIGIATHGHASYDVVPLNGRIPNPQSPSISPDGSRLVFSDYCGGEPQLFIARVDGKTGDTCDNAFPLATRPEGVIAASWGPNGYVAAETKLRDIVLVPSDGSAGIQVLAGSPASERNPSFAPASFKISCVDE